MHASDPSKRIKFKTIQGNLGRVHFRKQQVGGGNSSNSGEGQLKPQDWTKWQAKKRDLKQHVVLEEIPQKDSSSCSSKQLRGRRKNGNYLERSHSIYAATDHLWLLLLAHGSWMSRQLRNIHQKWWCWLKSQLKKVCQGCSVRNSKK